MYGYFPRYYWQLSIYTPMLEPLFDAIYNRYLATGFAAEITELYNTEAMGEAVMPYSIISMVSNIPDWTFTENFENFILQFSLFSETSTNKEILDAAVALKSAFDFFDLNVAGFSTVSMTRGVSTLVRVEKVWQYKINYHIELQNN